MQNDIQQLRGQALQKIASAQTPDQLDQIQKELVGKRGKIRELLAELEKLPNQERIKVGQLINRFKQTVNTAVKTQREKLQAGPQAPAQSSFDFDPTLPVQKAPIGHLHPISQMLDRVVRAFALMGFEILEGPEIDTDENIFQLLNMPPGHPARDTQDSFYITDKLLPRTHTSSVQIRALQTRKPPFKIIVPGRCYRNEKPDPRHTTMFYQFEGIAVDTHSTLADLKGTLTQALKLLFEDEHIRIRFRQSYFPYTEPSLEVDATCILCQGRGCRVCGQSGWLELLGAGMIHPKVLENGGLDPARYQGFAFGTGPERILMVKHQIPETKMFFENDLRFLYQF